MSECTREGKELQYNYIYMNLGKGIYHQLNADLSGVPGIELRDYAVPNPGPLKRLFFRLHWSAKINAVVKLPLKRLWFRSMTKNSFQNGKPTCFIFLGGQYILASPALKDYIHQLDSRNRCVVQYGDLIAKKRILNFEQLKQNADYHITYDKGEAEKFGIYYHPMRLYSRTEDVDEPEKFDYDLYFLGNVKDRLPLIMKVYQSAVQEGLRCKFLLAGVPKEQQGIYEGITYIQQISYHENLSYVKKSKCILEIAQGGSTNNTLRLDEAISYHRKLLTNCTLLSECEYYIPETMQIFVDVNKTDWAFLREPIPYAAFQEKKIDLSPMNFLRFLDSLLLKESGDTLRM